MARKIDKREAITAGRLGDDFSFFEQIWALTARVPTGRVTTYAELARAVGGRAYRAVGQAMNRNPYAPDVPCHRVVGSDGSLTGFASGVEKKRAMLEAEGVPMRGERVDLEAAFFSFCEADEV